MYTDQRSNGRREPSLSGRLNDMIVTRGVCSLQRTLQSLVIAAVASVLVACGQTQEPVPIPLEPLQSPIQAPSLPGNVTVAPAATAAIVPPVQAATVAVAPTPTGRTAPTATTARIVATASAASAVITRTATAPALVITSNGTPDTRATSQAVILTLTALALPPTRGPTRVPTRPVVIGAGGGRVRVTHVPTPTLDPSGVTLLSLSKTVYRGGAVTLSIRTKPGAQCQINTTGVVISNAVRKAGSDGTVAWIWSVDATIPTGSMVLKADCGSAGVATYAIEIQP